MTTESPFLRSAMLLGEENVRRLARSAVLLCGVGGVGSYVAEGLARAGVGRIGLVDHDLVALSNCNRQLIAKWILEHGKKDKVVQLVKKGGKTYVKIND